MSDFSSGQTVQYKNIKAGKSMGCIACFTLAKLLREEITIRASAFLLMN